MARVSITRKIEVRDPSARPAWRNALTQWQWAELAGTAALSGQAPADTTGLLGSSGLVSRINAWNGFCSKGAEVYLAAAGGHYDYFGNEAYKLDLSAATPSWLMLNQPTPGAQVVLNVPYYTDGRPTATHLYYAFWAVGDELIRVMSAPYSGNGNTGGPEVDAFSLIGNDWRRDGIDAMYPDSPPSSLARAICKDPRDDTIYFTASTYLSKRHPITGAWTQLASWPQNGSATYYCASAVDTLRNRVVFFGDGYRLPLGGLVYDIATNSFLEINFSSADGNATAQLITPAAGHSAWYVPELDRFIVKTNTTNKVYLVHPETWVVIEQVTTGGGGITAPSNGIFNKFVRVPGLGGIFYQPNHASNGWFLATE